MATFKVETKNKVDIDKKPKVYFACHPDDFDKHFKKVCNDIFKTHDCAIYYTRDMTEVIAEDEKQVDLGRNNLFVVPVTFKLLTTPNRAMDEDIPYALKEHIPVLPIMMEPGIDEFYSKPDKFGELQYLNPYSTDLTEISYEEKLKKYLESVLISDELAKRVRAAFDAYIFLSYRKKDRRYANELMRLIHSHQECRDIAIWFDEFLTPGESFKENIEKILDDCRLFTLLVTPQLLEKVVDENGQKRDNYVMSVELPAARRKRDEKGTDILAVKMEKIREEDAQELRRNDIASAVDVEESEIFTERLLEAVSKIAVTRDNTPEHTFLIGLAYLDGIDVEVNRERGAELICSAAQKNLPEAISKLVDMYENGICLERDIEQALMWQNRLIGIWERKYKKTRNKTDLVSLFWERYHCAELYMQVAKYDLAEAKIKKIWSRLCATKSSASKIVHTRWDVTNCVMSAFLLLSEIYIQQGDLAGTEYILETAQSFYTDMMLPVGEDEERDAAIGLIVLQYEMMYLQLAKLYKELHSYEKVLEYAEKAMRLIALYLPETSPFYDRRAETMANELAGDAYFYLENIKNAETHYKRMYELAKLHADEHEKPLHRRDLAYACNRMGEVMFKRKRFKEAKQYFLCSFDISENMTCRGDEDEGNMAFCYNRFGDICRYKHNPLMQARYYKKAYNIRLRIYEKSKDMDATMHLAYSCINRARTSLLKRPFYVAQAKALFEELIEQSPIPDFYRQEMETLIGIV